MSDIKSRLIDGLQGQAIKLPAMYGNRWLLIDKENLGWIAERLLSLPGIAIVELPEPPYDGLNIFKIGDKPMSPELARELAASMLAAAVQAQEEK